MRCPACEAPVDETTGSCRNGHALRDAAGVIRLVPAELAARLAELESAVAAHRLHRGRRPIPPEALAALPEGPAVAGDHEWRLRRLDLELVRSLISGTQGVRVLDVGAWSGWLSARLAGDGHDVTAVEYFAGPESLGAHAHATTPWRAIQLDLADLSRLEETFDLVVFNRGLQFFPDPPWAIAEAARRVTPGGRLVVTGLAVFRSPAAVAARVAAERADFRARYGMDLFLRPAKGYLDAADLARLESAGLRTRPYPGLALTNLRARLDARRPEYRYGLLDVAGP